MLRRFGTSFSPDTILRWHRQFIARKYDGSANCRPGLAPTKANMIRDLVLRMADENPSWGYGRIHGELRGLGCDIHWQTVRRVVREHGLLDDPDRPEKTSWKTFLQSHWESIAACDVFTVEAWTKTGLTRFLALFVIDLATRRVRIAGVHHDPCETQMLRCGRDSSSRPEGYQCVGRLFHVGSAKNVNFSITVTPPPVFVRRNVADEDCHVVAASAP